jgi:hypothetical protein
VHVCAQERVCPRVCTRSCACACACVCARVCACADVSACVRTRARVLACVRVRVCWVCWVRWVCTRVCMHEIACRAYACVCVSCRTCVSCGRIHPSARASPRASVSACVQSMPERAASGADSCSRKALADGLKAVRLRVAYSGCPGPLRSPIPLRVWRPAAPSHSWAWGDGLWAASVGADACFEVHVIGEDLADMPFHRERLKVRARVCVCVRVRLRL